MLFLCFLAKLAFRLERDTDEDRIQGERGRARVQRSFHAELDDLEAKVKLATDNDNNNSNQPLEKLPPLNSNYLRQKSRIPVPARGVDTEDQSKSSMDEIINKFSKKTEIEPAKSKFDELYNKSAILEKHKQFVKPRLTVRLYVLWQYKSLRYCPSKITAIFVESNGNQNSTKIEIDQLQFGFLTSCSFSQNIDPEVCIVHMNFISKL